MAPHARETKKIELRNGFVALNRIPAHGCYYRGEQTVRWTERYRRPAAGLGAKFVEW